VNTFKIAAAALFAASLAGAAWAQDASGPMTPSTMPSMAPPPRGATPATPSADNAATNSSATVDQVTVTNGPVPDTPTNRAKYGKPMSHAGKMTKPAGN
jgi:hypothetical protein